MTALAKVEDQPAPVPAPAAPTQTQAQTTIAAEPALEARQPVSPSAIKNDVVKNDAIKNDAKIAAASAPAKNPSSAFTLAPGSAAAPAPAKEVTASLAKQSTAVESEPANPPHDSVPVPMLSSVTVSDAPSFAALDEEDSGGSGRNKKILTAAVVLLALVALVYFGYGKLDKSGPAPASQPVSTPHNSGQPAPALAPTSSSVGAPSTSTHDRASSTTQTLAPKTATAATLDKPSAGTGNSPVIRIPANIAENPEPETNQPNSAPIRVKSSAARAKTHAEAEESTPLPSPLAVASADDSNLSGLMPSSSSAPKLALATVRISQGVSQGLLIKRVQPKYPPAALAIHAAGAVQIEATINKEGSVTNLKVLSGDAVLARAAVEAVRQWRYKPYYLDGAPVEIQTQITVNFKAN
jgi:protein TonB